MAKKYFIPTRRGDRSLWLANYKAKIAIHGATLGLLLAEVTAQQTACDNITNEMQQTDQAKADYEQQVEEERAIVTANLKAITDSVARQKTHANFTDAIGDDLGTIGEEQTIDVPNEKPQLRLRQTTEGWVISFNLKGFFDAVKIERKRPAGQFTFLAIDTSNPYLDSDPQENGTEYRAVFMLADQQVGQWSDSVKVQV